MESGVGGPMGEDHPHAYWRWAGRTLIEQERRTTNEPNPELELAFVDAYDATHR